MILRHYSWLRFMPSRITISVSEYPLYNEYEIRRPFPVREGKVAPWFDRPGGGTQYKIDTGFEKKVRSSLRPGELLIDGMVKMGYLRRGEDDMEEYINKLRLFCECKIDIVHKNRGYCSFYVQCPRNQGDSRFMHGYA